MTYGQMRDRVLMLLNQYSIAGGRIKVTYNNQADYLARVPGAVNDALLYLATTARRLRCMAALGRGEETAGWSVYALPEDCWQVCAGGVFRFGCGTMERCASFRLLGERQVAIPGQAEDWQVEYFRYPVLLKPEPEETASVDCPPEALAACACYAAAQLAGHDDAYLQAVLQNEFENRLSRLGELPSAARECVDNAYGGWEDTV